MIEPIKKFNEIINNKKLFNKKEDIEHHFFGNSYKEFQPRIKDFSKNIETILNFIIRNRSNLGYNFNDSKIVKDMP